MGEQQTTQEHVRKLRLEVESTIEASKQARERAMRAVQRSADLRERLQRKRLVDTSQRS